MTKKEETPKTHYLTLLPTNHIRVADIPVGKDVTLTIKSTGHEEFYVAKAKEHQRKGVVKFVEGRTGKFLILNKTRADQIAELHGDYLEDWIGKQITIYVVDVKVGKKMEPGIRVRKPNPSGVDLLESGDDDLSEIESNGEGDLDFGGSESEYSDEIKNIVAEKTNITESVEIIHLLNQMNIKHTVKTVPKWLVHYNDGVDTKVNDPIAHANGQTGKDNLG